MENYKTCCSEIHTDNGNSSCCGVKVCLCCMEKTCDRRRDLYYFKACLSKVCTDISKCTGIHCKKRSRNFLGFVRLAVLLTILKVKYSILINILMKYCFCLNSCVCKKKLVLISLSMLILFGYKYIFILDTEEDIAKLHAYAFGTAFNKCCKLIRFFIGMILE